MNTAAKGRRVEHKVRDLLEVLGYAVTRSAGSKGAFDLVAIHPTHTRCVQVKSNKAPNTVEREGLQLLARSMPPGTSVEVWVWKDRAKAPEVEVMK